MTKCIEATFSSQTSDVIAHDHQPEISLTNFKILSDSLVESEVQKLKKFVDLPTTNVSSNADSTVQQSISAYKDQICSSLEFESDTVDSIDVAAGEAPALKEASDQEPFVVVWEQLSFEIKFSLHDRFISNIQTISHRIWPWLDNSTNKQKEHSDIYGPFESRDELNTCSSIDLVNLKRDMKISNRKAKPRRTIFENLNGFIESGKISAILGPSGAGKTSLLNAISGKTENYRGSIQIIGGGSRNLRLSTIPQKDHLIESLTVEENLLYSSKILNTDKYFDHEMHILTIVKMLDLTRCIKSSVSNISGGEYKRVSIAQELFKNPDILVLDEPTSGLDSLNCKNLIKSLAQLIEASQKGSIRPIAIVMTIHQPDIDIFEMFDSVYCMARNGRVIYDGNPKDVMQTLNYHLRDSINYQAAVRSSSLSKNPANLLIEIASEGVYGQEIIEKLSEYQKKEFHWKLSETIKSKANVLEKQQKFNPRETLLPKQISVDINNNISLPSYQSSTLPNKRWSPGERSTSSFKSDQLVRNRRLNAKKDNQGQFRHHVTILAKRAFKSTLRDPILTITSFLFHLTIPLAFRFVYSQRIGSTTACPMIQRELDMISIISDKTSEKIVILRKELALSIEATFMLFLITYAYSMCSIAVTALTFPLNMHILLKEIKNGWYNLPSFVFAKTIANFPFEVIFPVMSIMLVYTLLHMPLGYLFWRFWAMALMVTLLSIISHTYGLIFGAIFMDSVETSIFLSLSFTLPQVLLSSIASNINSMPYILQYMSWLSLYRYSTDSLKIIRFGYGICPCDDLTARFLEKQRPNIIGVGQSMKRLFNTYLLDLEDERTSTTENTLNFMIGSPTETLNETMINTTSSTIIDTIPTGDYNATIISHPLGVQNFLEMGQLERAELIAKIDSGEIDPFKRLADLLSKSFTYGRDLTTCDTVRSEVLMVFETPDDSFLPYIFLGMITLLIATKILLFIIVRYKIRKRI